MVFVVVVVINMQKKKKKHGYNFTIVKPWLIFIKVCNSPPKKLSSNSMVFLVIMVGLSHSLMTVNPPDEKTSTLASHAKC